ncbi:MAG: hypothetical protein AAF975_04035 [Spirochaetota bacterium]
MKAFLFTATAYFILPVLTLYSCLAAIYLWDFRDPEFWRYVNLWIPGIFLYYIYIGQLIIGQRLPFLDRIWGFPNLVRKHQGLFRVLLLITLIMHSMVHLRSDGLDKVLLNPDSGMIVAYIVVFASIALMVIAVKFWLKLRKKAKVADYAKMHKLHQLFYLLAIGIWYHVVTAGAFQENYLGSALVTAYLLFALLCKVYMIVATKQAPVYRLDKLEVLHENFVRLSLRSLETGPKVDRLHRHKAGQYAYFSFALEDEKGKVHWEQHPFSFAGLAAKDSTADSSVLSVVVKKLGNFTARLGDFTAGESGVKVKVLGPYGIFSCESPAYTDGIHLVAAGAGITPFLSMLEEKTFIPAEEKQALFLHWFVREASELVFEDRFRYFCEQLPNLTVKTYVGQSLSEHVLQKLFSSTPVGNKWGVLYCGPGAVGPVLRKVITRLGIPRRNFHSELFSM